ncbi:MAG: hypothetical protein HZB81_04780 [Deltaproteobacteria bacterium]|nr:hypothetical protein [Deltaproteobacteria bacterium]
MKEERKNTLNIGMKIGATFGGIAFLIFGILPGFYFGGYGTLLLLTKLTGDAVAPTLLVRAILVAGITIGIFSIGALSLVVGAILGTAAGYIVNTISALVALSETKEAEETGRVK